MNELAFHCSIYWHVPVNVTAEEALTELKNYLEKLDIDYQMYDAELRDFEGAVIEKCR